MQSFFSIAFLRPPASLITLALLGVLLALRFRRIGLALASISSLCLFAAATPALSSHLLHLLETRLPPTRDFRNAQAIVVLGGNIRLGQDDEDIDDSLGRLSIERVVMAARAYRQLQLPIAVSGGRLSGARSSEAALMKAMLERDFAVPVTWSEDASRSTWENAVYTTALLRAAGITTVVLVSQAWHLPRAVWAFERAGLTALPWLAPPTVWRSRHLDDFLPSIDGLADTKDALHELIGMAYYRLHH
jgi:uncharacterized SAM-binding protein YcdF (DUF218 family)